MSRYERSYITVFTICHPHTASGSYLNGRYQFYSIFFLALLAGLTLGLLPGLPQVRPAAAGNSF